MILFPVCYTSSGTIHYAFVSYENFTYIINSVHYIIIQMHVLILEISFIYSEF